MVDTGRLCETSQEGHVSKKRLHSSPKSAAWGAFKDYLAGVAVLTVDSVGRRPLLLWGVGGMTVALVGLGGSSLALSGSVSTWSSVAALLLYVGAYQVFN